MDEVPRDFAISDMQSSPARDERSNVCCVRSRIIYGSKIKSLLPDVGLKFERAEMQMIYGCGSFP